MREGQHIYPFDSGSLSDLGWISVCPLLSAGVSDCGVSLKKDGVVHTGRDLLFRGSSG